MFPLIFIPPQGRHFAARILPPDNQEHLPPADQRFEAAAFCRRL